jgi:hypothetical protein
MTRRDPRFTTIDPVVMAHEEPSPRIDVTSR